MAIDRITGPALRDLRERGEKFLARAEAQGGRIISFDCPHADCSKAIRTLAPPAVGDDCWDTLSTCPHCGGMFKKFTTFEKAWGVLPPPKEAP